MSALVALAIGTLVVLALLGLSGYLRARRGRRARRDIARVHAEARTTQRRIQRILVAGEAEMMRVVAESRRWDGR